VTKEYRPWTPEQTFLLPQSPMEWLPEGHLAYFVLELVRELDLSAIEDAIQSKDGRGTRPYSPRLGRLPMTRAQEARWQMHQKVTSAEGRAIYARRKVIVEPVFGQIKQAMGFRRFSLRGLAKAAAEWGIVCLCHNLLKLHRALWASATAS
jgi:hypothetical protein